MSKQPLNMRLKPITANDAYSNPAAKLGYGAEAISESVEYPLTRLTQNYMLLLSLYRGSGILRRIVNKPVEDAVAHWYRITSQMTPEQIDMIQKLERKTKLKCSIEMGLKWGRLFGGAAGLIRVDGQGDILDKPLDLDTIEPDSFKGLSIVDRWSGIYPSIETVNDIGDPDFGEPEYYEVRVSENDPIDVRVHHSRIVRFMGDEMPYWEKLVEQGWGASIIETVFDELKMYDSVRFNISQLIYQANIWVQKSDDLAQSLGVAPRQAQDRLYQTLHAQNALMSSFTTRIIGKDEDLQNRQYTFSGLDKVFEMYMYALSSVSGIPITILFGRSPGGLDATGDADMDNYYTLLESIQENKILPALQKLLPVMCMSEFGAVPDDLDMAFNPVRIPTEKEKADIANAKTTAIMSAYDGTVISRKTALKELRQLSDDTGMFSNITDEDIEQADDTSEIGDMPSLGDMGAEPEETGPEENPKTDNLAQKRRSVVQRIKEIASELAQKIRGADADFDESKHPKSKKNGRFVKKNGGSESSSPQADTNKTETRNPTVNTNSQSEPEAEGKESISRRPPKSLTKKGNKHKIKLSGKEKIIHDAFEDAKKNPPNYFELSGRDPSLPQRLKATGFSHESTRVDHFIRHGKGVGAKNPEDYEQKAKSFFHAPLGNTGDVHFNKNKEVLRYDRQLKYFTVVRKNGVIKTYRSLLENKSPEYADRYWEDQKNDQEE